ncbi:MAG TPA: invasion associated locus B family protein, partial [Xanthobacteraceae bacterium]
RDQAYVFVSTRPAENVRNEVSVIIGYPFKPSTDAAAEIGADKFAMYTLNDGAWIKNVAEEARMVDSMRKGSDLTVKGVSKQGTESTDQYSLKGLSQALDRASQECK